MSIKQREEFFKVKPKPGIPLSVPGIAEGIAAMAKALERMTVLGGAVQWTDGVPTIIVGVKDDGSWVKLSDGGAVVANPPDSGVFVLVARDGVVGWEGAQDVECP